MSRQKWDIAIRVGDTRGLADSLLDEIRPAAEAAVLHGADMLVDEAVAILRAPRSSPAAAGEPPAMITGELADSIERIPVSWPFPFVVESGAKSDLPQAGRLEFGGSDKTGRRIAPHPFLRTAGERARARIYREMERTV